MPSPVKHTCPDIDKAIKQISNAMKAALDGKKECTKGDDIWACFDAVEDELWGLTDKLEDLRSDNDHLRNWGHECEESIKELEDQIQELENKLSEISA